MFKACRCALPVISCSYILTIGALFDRPQPGTRVGKKWEFFRLLLPPSCGQFCSRSESGPNPTNYWGIKWSAEESRTSARRICCSQQNWRCEPRPSSLARQVPPIPAHHFMLFVLSVLFRVFPCDSVANAFSVLLLSVFINVYPWLDWPVTTARP